MATNNDVHIVSVSGGASSAATLLRIYECYNKHTIYPVFCDTNWESPDLYRFITDLENYIDIPIHRINTGLKPSDISEREHMIFNSRIANCTKHLKIIPMQEYAQSLKTGTNRVFMHIGFNLDDRYKKARTDKPYGRLQSPIANWQKMGIIVKYPLWWQPRIVNPEDYIVSKGLELPEVYKIRKEMNNAFMLTNNCSSGCFKQGVRYWRGLYLYDRDTYNTRMEWENSMRLQPQYAEYAICTHTIDGVKVAYPLAEIARDTEKMLANPKHARIQELFDDIENDCVFECQVF